MKKMINGNSGTRQTIPPETQSNTYDSCELGLPGFGKEDRKLFSEYDTS